MMLTSPKFSRASFIPFLKIEMTSVILCPLTFLLCFMSSQKCTFQIASVGFLWPKFTPIHSSLCGSAIAPRTPRLSVMFLTAASVAMQQALWMREASLAFLHLELLLPRSPGALSASPTLAQLQGDRSLHSPALLPGVIAGLLTEGVQ